VKNARPKAAFARSFHIMSSEQGVRLVRPGDSPGTATHAPLSLLT